MTSPRPPTPGPAPFLRPPGRGRGGRAALGAGRRPGLLRGGVDGAAAAAAAGAGPGEWRVQQWWGCGIYIYSF